MTLCHPIMHDAENQRTFSACHATFFLVLFFFFILPSMLTLFITFRYYYTKLQDIFHQERNVLLFNNSTLCQCCHKMFCSAVEIFLSQWGNLPTLKGFPFERVHSQGNSIFIDYSLLNKKATCCFFRIAHPVEMQVTPPSPERLVCISFDDYRLDFPRFSGHRRVSVIKKDGGVL